MGRRLAGVRLERSFSAPIVLPFTHTCTSTPTPTQRNKHADMSESYRKAVGGRLKIGGKEVDV